MDRVETFSREIPHLRSISATLWVSGRSHIMNFKAFVSTMTSRAYSMPIVILYVTEGCNLQCITCSYRQPLPGELSIDEIRELSSSLQKFGLKHIVYSGGEPLLRRDFPQICGIFRDIGARQTLLTNGLLLEKRLPELSSFTEIIVSVDGPDAGTHNSIRGVLSFDQIVKGIKLAARTRGAAPVSIRTVVQKRNFRRVPDMVEFARSVNSERISFLAADVLSESFGRDRSGPVGPDSDIALNADEAAEFREIIERMIIDRGEEISSGFISESPAKLRHIVQYFEALTGKADFPTNVCNAPMISAVITSTGDIHPCYFLSAYGNIRETPFARLANSPQIMQTRKDVRQYRLERCKTCVCTLHVQPLGALLREFS